MLQGSDFPSFASSIFELLDERGQPQKIFDSKQSTSRRDNDKRISRLNVSPVKRNGRQAVFLVEKENASFPGGTLNAVYLKYFVAKWMKWMDDSEAIVVQVLVGCSCDAW